MAVAVTSLLAASSLVFGMTVSAAHAEPADMTGNVALANPQLPSEAENTGKPNTPVSQTSELVRGGVNPPRAVFLITGGILFIAGSGLLLLRRRQPYD
jgi:hypothetical protein